MANDFYMQAGLQYHMSDGSHIALGVVPGILEKEVWKNPYLLNDNRDATNAMVQGVVLNYDKILGSNVSLEIAAGQYQIDDERSGELLGTISDELNREADLSYLSFSHVINVSESVELEWQGYYLLTDAQGGAMSSTRYGVELELQKHGASHSHDRH